MPNTTNFNWPTPADTDLVKDGAAAIRNLGDGVDTSLVDLKGGTTGQILSKASNADMDFAFVTPNVGDLTEVQAGVGISVASGTGPIPVITNSSTDLITTAGDILYGTAADTVARLGIGTANQVLKVNSGATAPEWAVDPTTDIVTTAGDLIYGTAADTVARLGIGTAGQVLQVNSGATAPEWAAPAGGNKTYTLLNTGGTALSGSSTVTVSVTTKEDYAIIITGIATASRNECSMRINGDTGSNYTTIFFKVDADPSSITPAMLTGSSATTTKIQGATRSDNASSVMTFALFVGAGNSTTLHPYTFSSGATPAGGDEHTLRWGQGIYSGTAAITSFSLINDAAANFTGGTMFIYGA